MLAQVKPTVLAELPIRAIDFADRQQKTHHDRIVQLVDGRIDMQKKLACARTPQEKSSLERQITVNNTQIDGLVYEAYGLTPEEIQTVERESEMEVRRAARRKTVRA